VNLNTIDLWINQKANELELDNVVTRQENPGEVVIYDGQGYYILTFKEIKPKFVEVEYD